MRYILNSDGYVYDVSFGAEISCSLGNCTEYAGEIPAGYSSLEEWHDSEIDRLNAWKIIDGNLVYDPNKASELDAICKEQAEKNRHVTKGELENAIANIETNGGEVSVSNSKELEGILPSRSASGSIIVLDDASSLNVPYFKVTSDTDVKNEITIISSTPNIMPSDEAVTQTIGGLTLTVNADRSIAVTGTATESGALTIAGTISNRNPILAIKANEPYYLAELPTGYEWAFYCYNGVDREQVYLGPGGAIELLEDKQVTHIELVWTAKEALITESDEEILTESGARLMLEGEDVVTNTTIYPMLNVGDTALEYEKHEENKTTINLGTKTLNASNSVIYENNACKLGSTNLSIDNIFHTYNPNSVIYSLEDVELDVDYKKSSFDYVTATGSNGSLVLKNTADGYGSIRKLVLENLTAGDIYILSSYYDEEYEEYEIDLSEYEGKVTISIENGQAFILQGDEIIGTLEDIYVKTYSPTTNLNVDGICNMTCEYMLESDFSIYCTRVEKDASIKMVEDQIKLEVSRASEVEGELRSSITVEAGRIEQIVDSVGTAGGRVTPASIVAAINDSGSSVKISADHIDIEGTVFPEISNTSGNSKITALDDGGGIAYNSSHHLFDGTIIHDIDSTTDQFVVQYTGGSGTRNLIKADYDQVVIGQKNQTVVNINGEIYINGVEFDGTARFG